MQDCKVISEINLDEASNNLTVLMSEGWALEAAYGVQHPTNSQVLHYFVLSKGVPDETAGGETKAEEVPAGGETASKAGEKIKRTGAEGSNANSRRK